MRKLTLTVSSAVAVLLMAFVATIAPTPGFAQALEEITVTARKTTESLQEVPLAITALGAEDIDRLGIRDLNQIAQQDTSVQFDEGFAPSDTRITIRGLSPTRGRPNAATLVDGIDVSSEAISNAGGSLLINPQLVDVQRIEIVKGPQSALYGRSAFAGAISYITKDPADTLQGDLFVEFNSEDAKSVRGGVSIPITDTLGVLINGLASDFRGIYKNEATDAYVGGSKSLGAAITFKWEPTDALGFKWRTEYTDDSFDVPAQKLLNDFMSYADLGFDGDFSSLDPSQIAGVGLAPQSSKCQLSGTASLPVWEGDTIEYADPGAPGGTSFLQVTEASNGLPGPLNGPGCDDIYQWNSGAGWLENKTGFVSNTGTYSGRRNASRNLENYMEGIDNGGPNTGDSMVLPPAPVFLFNNGSGSINGYTGTVHLGDYIQGDVDSANLWNKQTTKLFIGKIPDADIIGNPSLSPNYMFGPGAEDPTKAIDFGGTEKEVFRTSLVAEWAVSDTITLTSLTGYTDASISTSQDIGKWFEDKCGPNQAALLIANTNPLVQPGDANYGAAYANGTGSTMQDYLDANGLGDDWRAYAPCTDMNPDGVNDLGGLFAQNSFRDTTQFSQELRMAWDITDAWNFTTGLQFWKEKLKFMELNTTMITSGAECYYNTFTGLNAQNIDDAAYSGFRGEFGGNGSPDANSSSTDPVKDQCGQTALIAAYWAPEAYAARQAEPSHMERTTDHYSWYGSVDWNITNKLTFRVEGRYTKEDNTVTGPVMTPCLNGEKYLSQLADPEGLLTGCSNGSDTASGQPDPLETANGGQATGPSAVLLCGQTGRCDRVAVSLDNYNVFGWEPGQTISANSGVMGSWWAFGFSPAPRNLVTLERTDRYWAPKATVEYFVNDDIMTYMSWSRGIKPGGFSLLTSGAFGMDANLDDDFSEIEFEAEVLDVWEIGAKTTLFDGRVRLNGAAFFQDFKDKQVTVQKVVGNTTGTEVVNISGSEVKGIELDVTWQATANWLLQGGYTYLDSEFTDYTIITQSSSDITRIELGNPGNGCIDIAEVPGSTATSKKFGCVASFNGNELERAPKHAVLLNATYTNNLFDTGMEWYTEANYRYQDSRWMEAFNIVEFPSYSLTDIRLGLLADAWDIQLYVNNVLDADTVISGGSNPGIANAQFNFGFTTRPGAPGIVAGPKIPQEIYANMPNPRIAGIRARFRFGQ